MLALLCAGVILLSAAWTRDTQAREQENRRVISDQNQSLSQARAEREDKTGPALVRPCRGRVKRGYHSEAVYDERTGLWQTHPAVDFSAETGEEVRAVAAGTVIRAGNEIRIEHGENKASVYRGIRDAQVETGQRVEAGQVIGLAGAYVPFEGEGLICVMMLEEEIPVEIGAEWVDKEVK